MMVERAGRIDRQGAPRIHLASAAGSLVSVCLVAPDCSRDVTGQAAQILDIVDGYLAELGSGREAVTMAQVWLRDIEDHPGFNMAWNDWIVRGAEPALSVVEAPAARADALIEIRVYAIR